MTPSFDIQRHLEQMEDRIREDIATMGRGVTRAQERAEAAALQATEQAGRIKALEEKAGWIGAGFSAGFFALMAFVWHIISKGF